MTPLAPLSQQIWEMKYRLKAADGSPIDQTIEDSFARVARALAAAEADPAAWTERFAGALADFRFLPAGRILAGAGAKRKVTLFNCFVMGTVPDDMSGIFEHLKEAALTMQQGGGIGYDFSSLRPKGAPVRGVGADASGPLSFMDVWDAMCRTIMSAGFRRGAMMATLACDHPDIEAFVAAKQEPGRLRMFNLSVLITDAFMQALKENAAWELRFGGVAYKSVRARDLWDQIMRATYAYAEPGVIFIDRINRRNNLYYAEHISATNPCVTADTWVQTTDGPRQVAQLVGKPFTALVDGKPFPSDPRGFFATGVKPVFKLATEQGPALRLTGDHLVRRVARQTRWNVEGEWRPASDLVPGDEVILHDHRQAPDWTGAGTEGEGYLLGLLIGDGTLKEEAGVLSVWPQQAVANGPPVEDGSSGVMAAALDAARLLPHRADFAGWFPVRGGKERRLKLAALGELARRHGMAPGNKTFTAAMEAASAAFQKGLLRGLFDTDGGVQGNQAKGLSIRLSQSDLGLLSRTQRMLLRFGICSTIYEERRPAGSSLLPDGKGGQRHYATLAQHELAISGENIALFAERIGFADTAKAARLRGALANYRRGLNRERFTATVASVTAGGEAEVFDAAIPGINAFDANGLYVHNCGEQPLPPYGACLLGSVNLARMVREPFTDGARLDEDELMRLVPLAVRMLDNAIDVSNFPLPAQAAEARAKRRIGLGVTGLADALIMVGARYGSARAIALTESWMRGLQRAAYLASVELAREKSPFPLYERDKYLAGETVRALDEDVREAIARHGIRNALLTSVAPTGTISLFADNVSSGLEPVFSFNYTRNILMPDGSRREEEVSDYAYRLYRRLKGEAAPLNDAFVDAQSLAPADHVRMQAAVQKYVDSSISKTINVPEDISFDDFKGIYQLAYDLDCKGCTTYRPNLVTGAVMAVKKDNPAQAELPLSAPASKARDAFEAGGVVYMTRPLDRPEALPGRTYKVNWPESEHAIYITINDIIQDGRRRPFEVFINSKNMEHYAWTVALTRMISAVFRRGGDVSFVVEELKAVFDPRGGQWMGGRYVPSLLAAIGEVIEQHLIDIGFMADNSRREAEAARKPKVVGDSHAGAELRFRQCPKCAQASLINQEGCDMCTSCGFSKCA